MLNGPILALDADLDVYAVVTYQLLGAQSGLFDIDNSTGEASARAPSSPAQLQGFLLPVPTTRARVSFLSAGSRLSRGTPFLTAPILQLD